MEDYLWREWLRYAGVLALIMALSVGCIWFVWWEWLYLRRHQARRRGLRGGHYGRRHVDAGKRSE